MFIVKLNATLTRTFRILPVLDAFAAETGGFVVHTPHTALFHLRPYSAAARVAEIDWTLPGPRRATPMDWLDHAYDEFRERLGISPALSGPVAELNKNWDTSQTLFMNGKWLNPDVVAVYQREASGPGLPPGVMARALAPLTAKHVVFNLVAGVGMSKLTSAVNLVRPAPDPDPDDKDGEKRLINGLTHRDEPPDLLEVMRIVSAARVVVTNAAWVRDVAAGYRVPSVSVKPLWYGWKYPYGRSFPGDLSVPPPDMPEAHVYSGYDCPRRMCQGGGECPFAPPCVCARNLDPAGLARLVETILNR